MRLRNRPALPVDGVWPIPFWKLRSAAKKLNRHQPVILICYDGDVREPNAQTLLTGSGFKDVRVLSGGFRALAAQDIAELESHLAIEFRSVSVACSTKPW